MATGVNTDRFDEEDGYYVVEAILQHRDTVKEGTLVREYVVKWEGYPQEEDSTWEPESVFSGDEHVLTTYKTYVDSLDPAAGYRLSQQEM
ncbi:MAG: hypothetical protein M1835_000843 [Candelina submexicana]|nr:MAG: hypothetical protein M1835_000843 [Candelina submexicana]